MSHIPEVHNYYLLQGLDFINQVEDMDTLVIMDIIAYALLPVEHPPIPHRRLDKVDGMFSPYPSTENLSQ